jgi:hypothetical protein
LACRITAAIVDSRGGLFAIAWPAPIPCSRVQLDRARDQKPSLTSPLDCYGEGWAEANLGKILDATAPGYRFRDPFVGSFAAVVA